MRANHRASDFVWQRPHRVSAPSPRWARARASRSDWSWLQDKPPLATRGMVALLGLDQFTTAAQYAAEWERQARELLTMSMGEVWERMALLYQARTGASHETRLEFCQRHFPRTWAGLHPERSSPEFRPLPEEASFAV